MLIQKDSFSLNTLEQLYNIIIQQLMDQTDSLGIMLARLSPDIGELKIFDKILR